MKFNKKRIMMRKMKAVILTGLLIWASALAICAQTAHKDLIKGDFNFQAEQFEDAEQHYRSAAARKPSAQAKFNLGNALYEQGRFQEAAEEFQQAMNLSTDTMFRAKALYNKGNSLLQDGKHSESLEAYKKSLLLNPKDEDVKRNFMYALRKQQQQQQEQKKEKQDNKNESQEEPEDQKNPPSQDEQPQNDDGEPQDQELEEQPQAEPEDAQPENKEMTREEAEQLLEIIENTDDYVQKKLKKQNAKKKQGEKNW